MQVIAKAFDVHYATVSRAVRRGAICGGEIGSPIGLPGRLFLTKMKMKESP